LTDKFYVSWRKSIRKLLNISTRTHSNLLPLIIDCLPIEAQILNRIIRFVQSCLTGSNHVITLLSNVAINGSGSNMSMNCNLIMSRCMLNNSDFLMCRYHYLSNKLNNYYTLNVELDNIRKSIFIKELLDERDFNASFLTTDELNAILFNVCTD